jgi:serine/threonine-protein kinase
LKGKLAYMAPEQVLGEPDLDRRADVFAMGVVIWELLAREHLFRGPNDAATMNRVLREPIPDVRSKRPDVPAAVAEIVARTLLREKTLRPATAAELAEALRGAGVPLATTTAVADYVEQLLGPSIVERREAVRAWLSASHDDREQRGPRSPEPVFDSPTLEMERPALPGDAGSPTIGAETGGASVVTSGGISSGPRLRREQGSLFPLVLSGVAVLIVVALGVLRFVGGASEKPAATLPPPSDSARETARSAAEAASTQSPVPSATASVVKQPDETPPTATAEASASARSTTRPPGQKKPARGAAPVPTDLAASPY